MVGRLAPLEARLGALEVIVPVVRSDTHWRIALYDVAGAMFVAAGLPALDPQSHAHALLVRPDYDNLRVVVAFGLVVWHRELRAHDAGVSGLQREAGG
jgi:hypothetical protein